MSFFTDIKTIVKDIEKDANVLFQSRMRHENESQNYSSFPVVWIDVNFTKGVLFTKGAQLISTENYVIEFLDQDEWDNREDNTEDEQGQSIQIEESSIEIYERMESLANGVLLRYMTTIVTAFETGDSVEWNITPLWRDTSNTMTGVRVTVSVPLFANKRCS